MARDCVSASEVKPDRCHRDQQQYLKPQGRVGRQPQVGLIYLAISEMPSTQYWDANAVVMLEGNQLSL